MRATTRRLRLGLGGPSKIIDPAVSDLRDGLYAGGSGSSWSVRLQCSQRSSARAGKRHRHVARRAGLAGWDGAGGARIAPCSSLRGFKRSLAAHVVLDDHLSARLCTCGHACTCQYPQAPQEPGPGCHGASDLPPRHRRRDPGPEAKSEAAACTAAPSPRGHPREPLALPKAWQRMRQILGDAVH